MRASLDGQPIGGEVVWVESVGVAPYVARLEIEEEAANKLFAAGSIEGSTLTLAADEEGLGAFSVGGLTILGTSASDSPHTLIVDVADGRWLLPRRHVIRSYNIRRKTGLVRRVEGRGGAPVIAQAVVEDFAYAPWSLRNAVSAWTPAEILDDVLTAACGGARGTAWDIVGELPEGLAEVEGLEIDASGDAAIAQALSAVGGGIGVRWGATAAGGNFMVLLFNRLDDSERELVGAPAAEPGAPITTQTRDQAAMRPRVIGGPLWAVQDRRRERPSAVRVLFDRAVELRVDYQERVGSAADELETYDGNPLAENVVRVSEDVSGVSGVPDTVAGGWLSIDNYLAFLAGKKRPADLPALTHAIIQESWLHAGLDQYGGLDPSGFWARRVATIREHYRRSFRLRRPWVDRIRGLRAVLASVRDTETHSQASSPVFQDYAVFLTWRGLGAPTAAFGIVPDEDLVQNRTSGPDPLGGGIVGKPLGLVPGSVLANNPAPARVSILDEEQGLFQVDFVVDTLLGQTAGYVNSALIKNVSEDLSKQNLWLQEGKLQPNWELSTVLLARPAGPPDLRRLQSVTIEIEGGEGPPLDVRIPAARLLARFAWPDEEQANKVLMSLWTPADPVRAEDGSALLPQPLNAGQLTAMAEAVAARTRAAFADRVDGGLLTGLAADVHPQGSATSVRHSVGPGGALTQIDLPPDPEPRDLTAYLGSAVRRVIDGLVDL